MSLLGVSRRNLLTGAGAAGLAGLGTYLYRMAPSFWKQYFREFGRPVLPAPQMPDLGNWSDSGLHAVWLGHTTVLLRVDGYTILTDPVFSERAGLNIGPLTLGVKRLVEPALPLAKLPRLDLILLSHAHMDHFDLPSLRALESRTTAVVTAWETSDLLRVNRYKEVREMRWGQRLQMGPVSIAAFPVNHWGARLRTDTHRGYNAYLLEAGSKRILFAGDTAITDSFSTLRSRRKIDLAIMPIGAYNPWIRYHCTPEQAWHMGNQAGAELFIPVHHGTFQLSREPVGEPIERFHQAAKSEAERIVVRQIGQQVRLT